MRTFEEKLELARDKVYELVKDIQTTKLWTVGIAVGKEGGGHNPLTRLYYNFPREVVWAEGYTLCYKWTGAAHDFEDTIKRIENVRDAVVYLNLNAGHHTTLVSIAIYIFEDQNDVVVMREPEEWPQLRPPY